MSKKIAIIGAGASGLAAIKSCLDEGLTPVCFERTDHIGGLWYYTEEVTDGQACVMKSTITNTSKETMCFSDFPFPAHFPAYLHNSKVLEYLQLYAQSFGAMNYVKLNTDVVSVKKHHNFREVGQWQVTVRCQKTGEFSTNVFDGVMVCNGRHANKYIPTFSGMDKFTGKIVHSHEYRHYGGYEGKKVLVVGLGNTACDIAVELSRVASQVYLSTRRGAWILHRIYDDGYPIDLVLVRRINVLLQRFLSPSVTNAMIEQKLNKRFNHANYGLQSHNRFSELQPIINDEIPIRIACGSIVVKPNVSHMWTSCVEFEDGTTVDEVDVVVMATGYTYDYHFIEHPGITINPEDVNLYKLVFCPEIEHPTLAIVGCIQGAAILPLSEIQCRWIARVFKGDVSLPSKNAMLKDIKQRKKFATSQYADSPRYNIRVDNLHYLDEIAREIGCMPKLGKLWLTDPSLATKCWFGPFSPYQYRLAGPGSWSGAREAILSIWERSISPTRSRTNRTISVHTSATSWGARIVLGLVFTAVIVGCVFR